MACGMDEAGLLNSMTADELVVTCTRLQRSCNDMAMLLNEFEQEQVMLRREQDRLHKRVEKVTAEIENGRKDRGIIWNLINDVANKPEVLHIFKAKEERKAAKRRRWSSREYACAPSQAACVPAEEDLGPFSDASVRLSWGCDVARGTLRKAPAKSPNIADLDRWVREAVCGDSVAEAEFFPDSAERVQAWKSPSRPEPMTFDEGRPAAGVGDAPEAPDGSAMAMVRPAHAAIAQPAHSVASAFGCVIEKVFGSTAVETPTVSRPDVGEVPAPAATIPVTVVLQRTSDEKQWGFSWAPSEFNKTRKERIVERVVEGSAAEFWNREQEQMGHPEKRILALDKLVSVNGKTGREDMRSELLAHREVVLEFHRTIRHDQLAAQAKAPEPVAQVTAAVAVPETAPAPSAARPKKDVRRATFQSAFSAYLQNVAPTPVAEGTAGELEHTGSAEAESSPAAPPEPEPQAQEEEDAPEAKQGPEDERSGGEVPAVSRDAPYGLLVQILSLGGGEVRLSWLFDWDGAVAKLPEGTPEAAARMFEVVQRNETTGDVVKKVVKHSCTLLALTLPVGCCYTFEVRAVLLEPGADDAAAKPADTAEDAVLWSSPESPKISADLRGPTRSKDRAAGEEPKAAEPTAPPARTSGIASRLGTFLAQQSSPAPCGFVPSSPSSQVAGAPASTPASPARGGPASPLSEQSPPPAAPVVMGPVGPLMTSKPRVTMNSFLDPAAEKRDIAKRLRIRHGGQFEEMSLDLHRQRSHSLDSDDEDSLMRLSSALNSLQVISDEAIGQEHRPEEHAAASSSSPAGGHQVARPAHDSAEDASWTSFRDPASGGYAPQRSADSSAPAAPPPMPEQPRLPEASSKPAGAFQLFVQIADGNVPALDFTASDDLPERIGSFVAQHKMRDLFENPLLERARLMVRTGQQEDTVDIIELL